MMFPTIHLNGTSEEILEAMGNLTTDAEADAMEGILAERNIDSLSQISDEAFFALIPLAIERAKERSE